MRSDRCNSPEPQMRRRVIGVVMALAIIVGLIVFVVTIPMWARRLAVRRMDAGAVSEAQRWLRWSAWFAPGDAETELLRAACFRRLGQMNRWEAALEAARAKGANPRRLQQEHSLGLIRMGAIDVPEEIWQDPARASLRPYDAIEACLRGHLARNEPHKAEQILASCAAALPQDAHVAYLEGVYWFNRGDEAKALTEFETAVARQPAHELAHTAVARLLEKQDRLVEALAAYVRFASSCPRSDAGTMGLVRVLRKLAHIEEARAVAESLDSSSDPFSEFRVEMGAIELELGNYQEAIRWFGQAAAAHGDKKQELLRNAATAFALEEEAEVANRLFERADAEEAAELRISELLTQLAVVPGRQEAADELQRLSAAAAEAAPQPAGIEQERSRVGGRENNKLAAAELFALHCAACHGADGSGDGRAARHQFPRPRDLRTEDFRLVSTDNGNPTVEDLKKVIKHGMPGTSMRAFDHLSEQQLQLLAEEVVRIRREGVRDWYVALLQADDEQIDEEDVQEVVDLRSLPGGVVRVPAIGPADPAAVARGKDVYIRSGCRPCHGDDGAGAGEVVVFDQQGLPEWPRDLVSGPFKGGHEPESIYLRILAGMPGSAHPATKTLTDQQYIDLVHYCRSLSRQPKQALTNHQRFLEATQRPLPSMVPETTADTGATTGGPP